MQMQMLLLCSPNNVRGPSSAFLSRDVLMLTELAPTFLNAIHYSDVHINNEKQTGGQIYSLMLSAGRHWIVIVVYAIVEKVDINMNAIKHILMTFDILYFA